MSTGLFNMLMSYIYVTSFDYFGLSKYNQITQRYFEIVTTCFVSFIAAFCLCGALYLKHLFLGCFYLYLDIYRKNKCCEFEEVHVGVATNRFVSFIIIYHYAQLSFTKTSLEVTYCILIIIVCGCINSF